MRAVFTAGLSPGVWVIGRLLPLRVATLDRLQDLSRSPLVVPPDLVAVAAAVRRERIRAALGRAAADEHAVDVRIFVQLHACTRVIELIGGRRSPAHRRLRHARERDLLVAGLGELLGDGLARRLAL